MIIKTKIISFFAFCIFFLTVSTSFAQAIFYSPGKADFQFKLVTGETEKSVKDSISHEGKIYTLSKKPLLTTKDIEAVALNEKISESQPHPVLYIFFKQSSWKKVYKATSLNIGKRLSLIIEGHLITLATIMEKITQSTTISIKDTPKTASADIVKSIKSKFKPLNKKPDFDKREKQYLTFLNKMAKKAKKIPEELSDIAHEMLSFGKEGAIKSLPWFEMLVKDHPNNSIYLGDMGIAYSKSGKYKKALTTYEELIKLDPDLEAETRGLISVVYEEMGDSEKADEEAAKSFKLLIPKYQKMINEKPEIWQLRVMLSKIYVELEKPGEAINVLENFRSWVLKEKLPAENKDQILKTIKAEISQIKSKYPDKKK